MMEKIELMEFLRNHFSFKPSELRAFREVKRELFVPKELRYVAYQDTPLPLIRGKTISQPTTVMIMTHLLELEKGDKIFEVGTGSGYQAAIIGSIVGIKGKIITTEVVPELVHFARQNLARSKTTNVEVHEDDGSKGMKSEAPFDKIIITAACKEFPSPLIEQLKVGGTIVGPVGGKLEQEMIRGTKMKDGRLGLEFFGQYLFTPMYGQFGFEV